MLLKQEAIAQNSINNLHKQIEDIFTGRVKSEDAVEQLMECFHPDFTMITLQGQFISRSDVDNMFRKNIGTRPQLRIVIDGYKTLHLSEDTAVCLYRETHHDAHELNSRWSVVLINLQQERLQWRYLHETAINK